MTVITLARQLGSGGDEIASRVAEALYLELVDHSRLRRAAVVAGVSEMAWAEMEMVGRGDFVEQITKALRSVPPTPAIERELYPITATRAGPLDGIFAPSLPPASIALADSVRILEQVVRHLADSDNVLIVGNGGQMILAGRPGVLHVSVVAPFEQRATAVQQRESISAAEARRRVRASDRNGAEYLRRFYQVRWDDPMLYHLTLNTGQISQAAAATAIVSAARALQTKTEV
jgi:cytidylate kinase